MHLAAQLLLSIHLATIANPKDPHKQFWQASDTSDNVFLESALQGMLLLAGSTTIYDILPGAGERKKQRLQVLPHRCCHWIAP